MYFADEQITEISGIMNKENVQSMKCRLTDKDNNKISSEDVTVGAEWSTPVELVWGYNTLTATLVCSDNKVYARRFEIFNACLEDADQNDDDGDGLPNYIEDYLGTDKSLEDSDGDNLTDYEEVYLLGTSPLQADSDNNGVVDGSEDKDEDGISNLDELRTYGTDPTLADTDSDGLTDYDEIFVYFTNPNKEDTDGDTLTDGEEVKLGLDPNLADSNNDGVPDNEEKIYQVYTPELEFDEESPITEMSVSFAGTGDITERTTVTDMMDIDVLSSNVVGLVGAPYEIETTSSFDEATITFTVDQTKLGDTQFAELGVLWYDEENDQYVIVDSVLNADSSTVTATVNHFSRYMVVNVPLFTRTMQNYFLPKPQTTNTYEYFDEALTWQEAKEACEAKGGHLATITSEAEELLIENLIADGSKNFYWLGATDEETEGEWKWVTGEDWEYTNWKEGEPDNHSGPDGCIQHYAVIEKSCMLWGDLQNVGDTLNQFQLEYGGYICEWEDGTIDMTDTDEDGLPDDFETNGMLVHNGRTFFTDPNNPDSDNDGLLDGEEINFIQNSDNTYCFKIKSDPVLVDYDKDGLLDNLDANPLKKFDDRFIIVDDINYFPEIDFIDYNKLGTGYTEFSPQYGTVGYDGRDYCYNTKEPLLSNYKDYFLLQLCAKGASIPLISNIAGKLSVDQWATMYHSSDFLQHFLDNTLEKYVLTRKDMQEIILTHNNNLFHYQQNINALIELCEETAVDGESVIFSSNTDNNFKVACYTNKHCTSHLIFDKTYDIDKNAGLDWSFSIGEAYGGMVCEVTKSGNIYTATYNYVLMDYYEWGYHVDGGDKAAHMLHECGLAREYLILGWLKSTISWEEGYRITTAAEIENLVTQ